MAIAAAGVRASTVYRRLIERLPVRTPERRIVPFRFNTAQARLWAYDAPLLDTHRPIRRIVLKARRLGVSTYTEGLLTAAAFLNDYFQGMVIAHEAPATRRIWAMSERFVKGSALRAVGAVKANTIRFRNSTIELHTAGSPDATRGADLTAVHLSEVASWKRPEAMLAILQCLPRDEDAFCIAVIESTAKGMVDEGELFYEEWQRAVSGESDFEPRFLPWHTFPEYTSRTQRPLERVTTEEEELRRVFGLTWGQLRWRRRVMRNDCKNDPDYFAQEYPCTPEEAFIVSGLPFFRKEQLLWLEPAIFPGVRCRVDGQGARSVLHLDTHGPLRVFKLPEPGHEYVIGADPAMGLTDERGKKEHSRSAAEVLDLGTLEQVAEYEGVAAPHLFARHLNDLGRVYNTAMLYPEVQASGGGGGRELIVYLRDRYSYPNLVGWRGANDRIRPTQPILYGWETTVRTKPQMLARIREVIEEHSCLLHSRSLVTQLRAYGQSDSDAMEALAGHDDLLMAFGIALMARAQNWMPKRPTSYAASPGLPLAGAHIATQDSLEDRAQKLWDEVLLGIGGAPMPQQPRDMMAW